MKAKHIPWVNEFRLAMSEALSANILTTDELRQLTGRVLKGSVVAEGDAIVNSIKTLMMKALREDGFLQTDLLILVDEAIEVYEANARLATEVPPADKLN